MGIKGCLSKGNALLAAKSGDVCCARSLLLTGLHFQEDLQSSPSKQRLLLAACQTVPNGWASFGV